MYHSGNQLIDPYLLFEKAQVREGMHVADFGCGRTGHLVFPAAPLVGEQGGVFAIDIMKDALAEIEKRASLSALHNVHPVWSDVEAVGGTAVPPGSLDIVFIVHTLIHATKRLNVLGEAERLLKPKGRVVVVDWVAGVEIFHLQEKKLVNFDEIRTWALEHDFAVQEEFEVGKYHKGLVLYRHD